MKRLESRIILAFFCLTVFPIFGFTDTNVSGTISIDTTWTKAAGPYIVTGNILVNSAISLTIEPGVIIKSKTNPDALKAAITLNLFPPEYSSCGNVSINGLVGTSSGTITRLSWDWGDGIVADSWFPASHRYRANGSYIVKVTAFCSTGETQSTSTTVSITNAEDALCNYGLLVYPATLILRGGKTSETLLVELRDAFGAPVSLNGKSVSFSSSNPAAVQVDASGVVKGSGFGEAWITVTVAGFPLTAKESVFAGEFRIEPPILLLATNGQPTGQINLKVANADGSPLNLAGRTVTFHGSNAVAQVNGSGLVTALRPPQNFGETPYITAEIDGIQSHNRAVIRVTSDPLNLNVLSLQEPNIIFYIAKQIGSFNYQQIFTDFDVPRITNIAYELEEEACGLVPFNGDVQYLVNDPGHGQDGTVPCGSSGNPVRLGTDVDNQSSCLIMASSPARPQWGVFFHEMGHNFTLASRSFGQFVKASDAGNSNVTFIEGLATAVSMYAGQMMSERATQYQIPANVLSTIMSSHLVWHSRITPSLDAYMNGGAKYSTITADILDDIISIIVGKYGYSILPRFFSVFLPPDAPFSFDWINSDAEQATFFVAAMSAAAGTDLRADFRNKWGFPIDDFSFNQLYPELKRLIVQHESARITLSKTSLSFGATTGGTVTSSQQVIISNSGGGLLNWSVVSNAPWLSSSPSSETGTGVIQISVNPAGLGTGTYQGTVSVFAPGASNSPQDITVTLTVLATGTSALPFGYFATPINGTTGITGAIPVTGWVLDDIETTKVEIWRDALSGETPGLWFIGDGIFVEGARPDVEAGYPGFPFNYRAGWGYMLLTNFLPAQGNGTYNIHAYATDKEGNQVLLGTKTITCDNTHAVKPFGAIDTPTQGGDASGNIFLNFGWVLTPLPKTVPKDGSTIDVYVDSVKVGNLATAPNVYNQYRVDVATAFPGLNNSGGPVGAFYLDTTKYANGVHTIHWIATDDQGAADGIGSRYFNIVNAGTAAQASSESKNLVKADSYESVMNLLVSFESRDMKRGFNLKTKSEVLQPDNYGTLHVETKEVERVEIDLGKVKTIRGYQVVGEELRPLPIGSTLNSAKGTFFWMPGPGFIGTYDLLFLTTDEFGITKRIPVKVTIRPKFEKY